MSRNANYANFQLLILIVLYSVDTVQVCPLKWIYVHMMFLQLSILKELDPIFSNSKYHILTENRE